MFFMSEMLYLQTERNIKITNPVVTLGDVAQLSCSDGAVLARNQVRRVAHLPDDGYGRYVCSALFREGKEFLLRAPGMFFPLPHIVK